LIPWLADAGHAQPREENE
jgi:hypothetical protein